MSLPLDRVALAASSRKKSIGMIHVEHGRLDCTTRVREEQNLISDVICIESFQIDNLALHGHRNGKISLVDYRAPTFMSLANGNDSDGGYVTSIFPLSDLSLVCRSSFGKITLLKDRCEISKFIYPLLNNR